MADLISSANPLVLGLAAMIFIFIIFKIIGLFTFLFRIGLSVLIGVGILYYFAH